jgi:HK97 family phage prohead protease
METRQFEFRIDDTDSDGRNLSGLVAPFNRPTRVTERGRTFSEVLKPGAFRDSINSGLPPVLYGHNRDAVPIAVCTSMRETDEGLVMIARMLQHPQADAVREAVQAGAVKGASIGFNVPSGGDSWRGDSERTITRLNLAEVSVTPWPCYETSVGVRSATTGRGLTRGERARVLREHQLARIDAQMAAYTAYKQGAGAAPGADTPDPVPSFDDAQQALAVVAQYFEALKSEQPGGSQPPPVK